MKVFIILDRSGSMADRWTEVQATLTGWLGKIDPKTKVWGLAFDNSFDWFASKTATGSVSLNGIGPRGMTALYDAIGQMAQRVTENVKEGKKAQIVIITDGAENCSKTVDHAQAGQIIKGWQAKGYDVVYLGADFDGFNEASKVGIGAGQTMSFDTTQHAAVADTLSTRSATYASTGQAADFTDEDRKKATGA